MKHAENDPDLKAAMDDWSALDFSSFLNHRAHREHREGIEIIPPLWGLCGKLKDAELVLNLSLMTFVIKL